MTRPFNKGDLVSLQDNYSIAGLVVETRTYWLYEAIQFDKSQTVFLKVYNNKAYSDLEQVKEEWKKEKERIALEKEYEGRAAAFVEATAHQKEEKKLFIIVFIYEESESIVRKSEKERDFAIREKDSELKESVVLHTREEEEIKAKDEFSKEPQWEMITKWGPLKEKSIDKSAIEIEKEKAEREIGDARIRKEKEVERVSTRTLEEAVDDEDEEKMKRELLRETTEEETEVAAETAPPPKPSVPGGAMPTTALPSEDKKRKKKQSDSVMSQPIMAETEKKMIYSETTRMVEMEGSVEEAEEKEYLKNVAMEYYDRMNPQKYYPLKLLISDIKSKAKVMVVNPLTGERRVQKRTELDVVLTNPVIVVRPTIPGCNVVPPEIETDFSEKEDELIFYITPLVKGAINGHIKFINEGKVIHRTRIEAKVLDPNYARAVAIYGLLASFLPKIITMLGINLGLSTSLNELWNVAEGTIGNMNIASMIGIIGIIPVVIITIVVRQKLKPTTNQKKYRVLRFRE
jgi:hypothetical protein